MLMPCPDLQSAMFLKCYCVHTALHSLTVLGASWNLFKMKAQADATPRPTTAQCLIAVQSDSTMRKLEPFEDEGTS